MSHRSPMIAILLLCAACASDEGMGPDGGGGNRLPQAQISTGGAVVPRVFVPGETLLLTAASTDPDDDDLTHAWSLSGTAPGTLSANSGESVTWTAGSTPGSAQISLVSNDGTADSPAAANVFVATATLVPSGAVADGTNWTDALSPYVVTSDIHVPQGATLTAEAGVEVYFRGSGIPGGGYNKPEFNVDGVFEAYGTGSARSAAVSLRGGRDIEEMQWNGLRIRTVAPATSTLRHCRIEEADIGVNVAGTGEVTIFGGRIENNATGVSVSDPDGSGGGVGVLSTALLRNVVISNNLGLGILVNSSNLQLRKCNIRDNAATGLSVSSSTDPASADVDSCKLGPNGGGSGYSLGFSNTSAFTHALSVQVRHSNFATDVDDGARTVSWGGCSPYPAPFQDFELTGNFWGVTQNSQTALAAILATMTGYSGCVGDPTPWQLASGDWVVAPHATGAP